MASIRKHRRKWQAQWYYTIDGKRTQVTRLFDTKGEARRFANQMHEEVERHGVFDPNRFTVRAYMRYWIDHHPKRHALSPTTLAGYRRHSDLGCRYVGDLPLAKLSALDLDRMYSALLEKGGVRRRKTRTALAILDRLPVAPFTMCMRFSAPGFGRPRNGI